MIDWRRLSVIRSALLVIGGFTCLAVAAFLYHVIAGFVATGLLLLVLEYFTQPARDGVNGVNGNEDTQRLRRVA